MIGTALLLHSSCDNQNGRSIFAPFLTFNKIKYNSTKHNKKIIHTDSRAFATFYWFGLYIFESIYQRSCSINALISNSSKNIFGKIKTNCCVIVLVSAKAG